MAKWPNISKQMTNSLNPNIHFQHVFFAIVLEMKYFGNNKLHDLRKCKIF